MTHSETVFDIEVVRVSQPDPLLGKDTLTIKNAPWYHYTATSAWHAGSFNLFVHGKNLGDPSDFNVVGDIFELTKLPGGAWTGWPWVYSQQAFVSNVGAGQTFTATLTFPKSGNFEFEPGKMYDLETYVVKRQNYATFQSGIWKDSPTKWELGSYVTKHLITP